MLNVQMNGRCMISNSIKIELFNILYYVLCKMILMDNLRSMRLRRTCGTILDTLNLKF